MKSDSECDPQDKDCSERGKNIKDCLNSNGELCDYEHNSWSSDKCWPEGDDDKNCNKLNKMYGGFGGGWLDLTDIEKAEVCIEYGKRRGIECDINSDNVCHEFIPKEYHGHG